MKELRKIITFKIFKPIKIDTPPKKNQILGVNITREAKDNYFELGFFFVVVVDEFVFKIVSLCNPAGFECLSISKVLK